MSASALVQEVIYIWKFLASLGYPQTALNPVFAWSEGSVGCSEHAKHIIDLCDHFKFVHEVRAAQAGHLKLESKIDSAEILNTQAGKASTPPYLDVF